MDNTVREDRKSVYEIGYLIAGLPEEKIVDESNKINAVLAKAGAVVIGEEAPKEESLAYTMRKKTLSGSYDNYDSAYFGWVKFELATDKILSVKNEIEAMDPVLRILVITAPRENTYLGKRARAIAETFAKKPSVAGVEAAQVANTKDGVIAAPVSIEEMDKSIDDMVKEA